MYMYIYIYTYMGLIILGYIYIYNILNVSHIFPLLLHPVFVPGAWAHQQQRQRSHAGPGGVDGRAELQQGLHRRGDVL